MTAIVSEGSVSLGRRRLSEAVMVFVQPGQVSLARVTPRQAWDERDAVSGFNGNLHHRGLSLGDLRLMAKLAETDCVEDAVAAAELSAADAERLLADLEEFGLLADPAAPSVPDQRRGSRAVGDGPHRARRRGRRARRAGLREPLQLRLPFVLAVTSGGFEAFDHHGTLVGRFTPEELWAIRAFAEPCTVDDAFDSNQDVFASGARSRHQFGRLVMGWVEDGVVLRHDPDAWSGPRSEEVAWLKAKASIEAFRAHTNELHARHDEEERERVARTGQKRARMVPVQVAGLTPPLSTGMVLAYAREAFGGALEEHFDFYPRWVNKAEDVPPAVDVGDLYLFTNYIWNHDINLDFARAVKEANPAALTIFGGPDCPGYPEDSARYLGENPQVDVIVRGEGEATFSELLAALAPFVATGDWDLAALHDVAGLVFRGDGGVVRTANRDRITDLDTIPSPYLTGLFDAFGATKQMPMAIIETNRGCPYGCTFCDWGSATNSRIRKFELDRVMAELQWCADHEVPNVFVADANFGIFSRDVDVARRFVELKQAHGFPQRFSTNYAKNTVKHLKEIVTVLVEGNVLSEGLLSLQTMDDDTLTAIRRSNIKLEKYEALSKEFHDSKLPLAVDLMLGLPGQTVESLLADFQQCVDREVNARCHQTTLLVNSPMNDPAYREEHQIVTTRPPGPTGKGAASGIGPSLVISSASFTRQDYVEMQLARRSFLMAENFGVLRPVTRFVRRETGIGEVELIERMRKAATAQRERWPHLALALDAVPEAMVQPVSWAFFVDEVRDFLVGEVGLPDDSGMETVLRVQHALLPAPWRVFPTELDLAHDYASWHREAIRVKDSGHLHDWETVVPRLVDLPPAPFVVEDPHDLCNRSLGRGSAIMPSQDWELASPVARPMPAYHTVD